MKFDLEPMRAYFINSKKRFTQSNSPQQWITIEIFQIRTHSNGLFHIRITTWWIAGSIEQSVRKKENILFSDKKHHGLDGGR